MKFLAALTAFAAFTLATPLPHVQGQQSNGQPQATSSATGKGSGTQAGAATQPSTSAGTSNGSTSGLVNAALVPGFGVTAGQGKQGGTCLGINGVRIPCTCPPDRQQFINKLNEFVQAGNAFGTKTPFPEDDSKQSQITRLQTSIVTLQNFDGQPGKGCPAASTTFVAQKKALQG